MGKIFNVSGDCKPKLHYMVDITERLRKIREYVDRGEYFTINRARQYGKTTTLRVLKRYLQDTYTVISLDFQKLGADSFADEERFSAAFSGYFLDALRREKPDMAGEMKAAAGKLQEMAGTKGFNLFELFRRLSGLCEASDQPVVLMIDEVDSAANNQVFIDFLAQMRGYYIDRDETSTFQSVILASVYDVKNLKLKIRPEDGHLTNSPWNTRENNEENGSLLTFDECSWDHRKVTSYDIAEDFDVDMSLSEQGIIGMLEEYERDYHTGMDVSELASLLYAYTSGYPYLVSRLCKLIDERLSGSEEFPDRKSAWTKEGFLAAVRKLLSEENTLFESLDNKLIDFPGLKEMLKDLLLKGKNLEYVPGDVGLRTAVMFGFVTIEHGIAAVSNRIFEMSLYNGFLAEEARHMEISQMAAEEKNRFIVEGKLDMELVLRKFAEHYTELFGGSNEKFLEDNGRCIFLLYIKPIINGTGNYYIEARTRTNRRTDVIIDFRGLQYVVELKLWRGMEYYHRGEEQLMDYLDAYHLKQGYMISFNFNKKKQVGVNRIALGDKVLIEAVV